MTVGYSRIIDRKIDNRTCPKTVHNFCIPLYGKNCGFDRYKNFFLYYDASFTHVMRKIEQFPFHSLAEKNSPANMHIIIGGQKNIFAPWISKSKSRLNVWGRLLVITSPTRQKSIKRRLVTFPLTLIRSY